jgi:tetratricopeptide (TPR) repeat protein
MKSTNWFYAFLITFICSCATHSLESSVETVLLEYGPESSYASAIPDLEQLEEEQLWEMLIDAAAKGRYDRGLALAVRLLDFEPDNDDIYHEMGFFLTRKERPAGAISMYQKAIQLNSDNHESHYNLAELYVANQSYPEAQRSLVRAVALDDGNDKYLIQLAKVYMLRANYDDAQELYLTVIEHIDANDRTLSDIPKNLFSMYADIYYDVALIEFYVNKDTENAIEYLQRYEGLVPRDAEAAQLRKEIEKAVQEQVAQELALPPTPVDKESQET